MSVKQVSILGIFVAVVCLGVATALYPGGFDWNRGYISTLVRGPAGPARVLADTGVLIFCVSVGFVFGRLARLAEFARESKLIRVGGIGSMVYSAFTITPLHDLMVTISLLFFLIAVVALLRALYGHREMGLFAAGCGCAGLFVAAASIYYSGRYASVLPWAQRLTYGGFAGWLVSLDLVFPRRRQ